MSKGVNIPIVSDASSVISEGRKVEGALDSVIDSLDAVTDQAKETDRGVETQLDSIGDTAKANATTLETKFSTAFDSVKKDSKTVGDGVGTEVKRGTQDASEGVDALKENTAANAKEMGASFQDVGSAIDSLQGLAAEALEGFGPMGIAAGVGLAAGIGIAQQALQKSADRVNQIKTDAVALAVEMKNATAADEISNLQGRWDDLMSEIVDSRSWFEPWQKEAVTALDRFGDALKIDRDDAVDFMKAFTETDATKRAADMADALQRMKDKASGLQTQIDGLNGKIAENANQYNVYSGAILGTTSDLEDQRTALQGQKDALDGATNSLQQQVDTAQQAADEAQAFADQLGMTIPQYQQYQQAVQADADAAAGLSDALASAADPVTTFEGLLADKTAAMQESAQATADATKDEKDTWEDFKTDVNVTMQDLIDDINKKAQQKAEFSRNLAAIATAGGAALADELEAQGPEAAGAVADLIAHATSKEQQDYFKGWSAETGKSAATGMANAITGQTSYVQQAVKGVAVAASDYMNVPVKMTVDDSALRNYKPPTINVVARVGKPQAI